MTSKSHLHQLLDALPEEELPAVQRVLEDQLLRALLSTPRDQEPLTAEEVAGILEAKQDVAADRIRGFENIDDLLAEFNSETDG